MSIPLEVFCCYAREDRKMLEHLKTHLAPLERLGQITVWSDVNLNAGEEWKRELYRHLESADIILLLISPDFMASDYCYSTEMKRAIERHDQGSAHVIPILLRPLHWDGAPFAKLQIIPTNAIPVTSWPNHDDAFYDVTGHISRFLARSLNQQTSVASSKHFPTEWSYATPNSPANPSTQQVFPVTSVETQKTNTLSPLPSLQLIAKPEAITILRTLAGHTQEVLSVVLSADGRMLASRSLDQTIKVWNVQTGQMLRSPSLKSDPTCVALSADGRILAIGFSKKIMLWNVQNGGELGILPANTSAEIHGHYDAITSVALSADGHMLASGDAFGKSCLWDTHASLADPSKAPKSSSDLLLGGIVSVALSADGLTLASGGPSIGKAPWVMLTKTQICHTFYQFSDHKGGITSVAISADGQIVASGSFDKTIKLWSVQKGKIIRTLKDMAKDVALNADGRILATASSDAGTIKLWNTQNGKLLCTLKLQISSISNVALSTDGRILVSGNSDGTITVWGIQQ